MKAIKLVGQGGSSVKIKTNIVYETPAVLFDNVWLSRSIDNGWGFVLGSNGEGDWKSWVRWWSGEKWGRWGSGAWRENRLSVQCIQNVGEDRAPPSPVYIPYVPKPVYQEYIPSEDDVLPAEEQPLPAAASPTIDSPGYIPESDPDEDPKDDDDEDPNEDPADYPADHDDDEEEEEPSGDDTYEDEEQDEDDDDEEEEHPASANSIPPPPSLRVTARISFKPQPPTLADRPEVTLPRQKRLSIIHCPGYEAGESSVAAAARPIDGQQAPPSPVYIPYVPEPVYPEYIPPEDDVFLAEEQPLPAAALPTPESPGYIPESDPEEDDDDDPEEDPADYPADYDDDDEEEEPSGDDADEEDEEQDEDDDDEEEEPSGDDADEEDEEQDEDDDDEEEEHPASADSIPPPPALRVTVRISFKPQLPTLSFTKEDAERFLAMPIPPPSPLTPLSSLLPQIPSPPLPTSPPILPIPLPAASPPLQLLSSDRRADRPEVTLTNQKRLSIVHCPGYKTGESLVAAAARPIKGRRVDYGFVDSVEAEIRRQRAEDIGYGIRDTWIDPRDVAEEEALTTLEGVNTRTEIFQRVEALVDDSQADRPEVTLPPRKRLSIVHCPGYEAGESSVAAAARPIEGRRADYGFVDSVEAEIRQRRAEDIGYATLTTQLSSLQGHLAMALDEIRALLDREQAHAGAPEGASSST
nr:hypothetical protein [Tanacetum cinerariifolium]